MLVLFSLTSLVCNYGNSKKLFSIVHAVLCVCFHGDLVFSVSCCVLSGEVTARDV